MIRESHRVQRAVQRQGYADLAGTAGRRSRSTSPTPTARCAGSTSSAGSSSSGHLALLGEIWAPFEREWIFPLGTVTLEGRTLPAPARPRAAARRRCTAPAGRCPTRPSSYEKDRRPRSAASTSGSAAPALNRPQLGPPLRPRAPAAAVPAAARPRRAPARARGPRHVGLDVGCGRGRDVRWLAKQGRPAVGLDYSGDRDDRSSPTKAAQQGWPAELRTMNLLELRHVLAWGALLAAPPRAAHGAGPAPHRQHLAGAGVDNFWRLVGMVLRPGERVHLEFLTEADRGRRGPPVADPAGRRGRARRGRRGARLGRDRPRGPGRRADRLRVRRGAVPRQAMADDCRLEVEAR